MSNSSWIHNPNGDNTNIPDWCVSSDPNDIISVFGAPRPKPVEHKPVEPPEPPPEPPLPEPPPPPPPAPEIDLTPFSLALDALTKAGELEKERAIQESVEIGLAVAEELAAGVLEVDPVRVLDIAQEAMKLLSDEKKIKIRIFPTVYEQLDSEKILDRFTDDQRVTIVPDASVKDLGCVVEASAGIVDARIRSRLMRLRFLWGTEHEGGRK